MSFPHEGLHVLGDRVVAKLQEHGIEGTDQVMDVDPFLVCHAVGFTPAVDGQPGDWPWP
ncbi:hypothetical protein [Gluconobacter sp. OJB]|uniref:hypothetical protein n=1 Tax=Gluconobacter sp. OJB TaxID=3145196 RepID=UPI0031F75E42